MTRRILITLVLTLFFAPQHLALRAADAPGAQKPLALGDLLAWKSITSAAISNDGAWFAYRISPNEGDGDIVIRSTRTDKEFRFAAGEIPPPPDDAPAGPPPPPQRLVLFSDDSRWAAFTIYPNARDARQLRRQNRPIQNKGGLVNLETGDKTEFDRVKRFAFAGERAGWIALHRYGPSDGPPPGGAAAGPSSGSRPPDRPRGSDLILHDLTSGAEQNIGNVADFSFDKPGRHLAWTIDAQDKIGNGVIVRSMESGVVRTLDSDKASYERTSWTEKGDAIAVLKGNDDRKYRDRLYGLMGWTDIDAAAPKKVAFKLTTPEGFTISPNRSPMWTEDLAAILFGIYEPRRATGAERDTPPADAPADHPAPADAAASNEPELPPLTLWHYRDPRLQSQQLVQESRDRNFSFLAEYRVKDDKFIRLADDTLRVVSADGRSQWAIGRDNREYELEGSLDGREYEDVYAVNLSTGERKLAAKKVRWAFGQSPDGTKFLHYDDGHFFVYDLPSGRTTDITKGAAVDFSNPDNDENIIKPPVNPVGWSKDSKTVLLSDGWDVWAAPSSEGPLVNLTVNGRKDGVRYRRRFNLDPEERGIDLSASVYFDAYGEWTKKQGVARPDGARPGVTQLTWDDGATSRLLKAKHAAVMVFTRETRTQYPDYYVGDTDLKNARRISDGAPQQKDFAWTSGSMLVNYTSAKGDKLQASLTLPANYQKGKSYPTVVLIYERMSQNLNLYAQPRAAGFNEAFYASNGYAVLQPDIKYRVNDPGMSAAWCVVPAVKAAIATGIVDAAKVAIHGHSWGGYQTAFLITQTDIFAAAIAGAPLTNLISMYSLIYKNSGMTNQAIFESSQGRFYGGYWDNLDAYMRNSPVFHAKNVKTPLMLLHNDRDGAVDFTQGVEYFNTLRRLGKPVVMLEYIGENHNLRRPVNQQDYTVRMKEFFDHHLMGKSAPDWLTSGVPRLKMEDHLRERQQRPGAPVIRSTTDGKQQ